MEYPANTFLADGTPRYRTFHLKLQPTRTQFGLFQQLRRLQCELYNAVLEACRGAWKWNRKSLSYTNHCKTLTRLRADRPDVLACGVCVCRGTFRRAERAFAGFFDRCKKGQTPGYPRFKPLSRFTSVEWNDTRSWKVDTENRRLYLQGIGSIKYRTGQQIQGIPRTLVVKQEGQTLHAFVQCSHVPAKPRPKTKREVGYDAGVIALIATSDGKLVEEGRFAKQAADRLARAQRNLATKQRGSNRRKHAVARVARAHRKVANQRRNLAHELSRYLVDTYDFIAYEDLKIENMVRRPQPVLGDDGTYQPNGAAAKAGLNRAIHDAGWALLLQLLLYKAEEAGRETQKVPAHHTSQRCSHCGHIDADSRSSQAEFRCTACSYTEHADINAAKNILWAGRALRASARAGSN